MYTVGFFFNDTATTEIYTLSLHDALPICPGGRDCSPREPTCCSSTTTPTCSRSRSWRCAASTSTGCRSSSTRSEEHTSELQSRQYLVCRLLLEKKKKSEYWFYLDVSAIEP